MAKILSLQSQVVINAASSDEPDAVVVTSEVYDDDADVSLYVREPNGTLAVQVGLSVDEAYVLVNALTQSLRDVATKVHLAAEHEQFLQAMARLDSRKKN